ncbi:MAG: 5'-methylthioadenosine phosphorylase [Bacteroidetes bacterium]|jgi:5'-methylthioadenosine phosphorylase|nr:5'-methylthioadenosine phosphorylase [Bacteroidota bacterium]
MNSQKSISVILGSAFEGNFAEKLKLIEEKIETKFETITLHRSELRKDRPAYVIFRHGLPHSLLPNQINYRGQAAALKKVNCGALLINSSVGVMDSDLPIYKPMFVSDLIMPENRLPDGSTCTMFVEPSTDQGHLLIKNGLFSSTLNHWLLENYQSEIHNADGGVVFVYAGGPRGKTPAENRMWAQLGGQVNSMTLAPEVVLANELEIPTSALVVGHKYSVPDIEYPGHEEIGATLESARSATEKILRSFLMKAEPVPFGNEIYRFNHE